MSFITRSNRGVETEPLFLVFAAVVLAMTITLVFSIRGQWEENDSIARTTNEANRLAEACNQIKYAGDVGSTEEITVSIPDKCQVTIDSASVVSSCAFTKPRGSIVTTKVKMAGSPATIPSGSNKVTIVNTKIISTIKTPYVITVS